MRRSLAFLVARGGLVGRSTLGQPPSPGEMGSAITRRGIFRLLSGFALLPAAVAATPASQKPYTVVPHGDRWVFVRCRSGAGKWVDVAPSWRAKLLEKLARWAEVRNSNRLRVAG